MLTPKTPNARVDRDDPPTTDNPGAGSTDAMLRGDPLMIEWP